MRFTSCAHLKKKYFAWSCSDWFWDNAHNTVYPSFTQSWSVFLGDLYFKPGSFPFVFIFSINVMFISPSPLSISIYLRRDWTNELIKILIQKWKSKNIILHAIAIFLNKNMNKWKTAQGLKRKKIYKHVHHEPH
jgi:hypothetical protein